MWQRLIIVLPFFTCAVTLTVPVDKNEDSSTEATANNANEAQKSPSYYKSEDTDVDSYLVPPDPHKPREEIPDTIVTPATYLLPPSREQQTTYYYPPTEPGEQSDWYPIAQALPSQVPSKLPPRKLEAIPISLSNFNESHSVKNTRVGRLIAADRLHPRKPSVRLVPPPVSTANGYIISVPSEDLELPFDEINRPPRVTDDEIPYLDVNKEIGLTDSFPLNYRSKPVEPTLALHLTPPKPLISNHNIPTKLYPKKFSGGFKPVPIPIAQFGEDTLEIPKAKPAKYYRPLSSAEIDYLANPDHKKIYLYQQAEQKRKLKGEDNVTQQQLEAGGILEETYAEHVPNEQETSETTYTHPGRNAYPVPLRQAPPAAPQRDVSSAPPAPDDRTEFRMHGMKGPHSYEFGFDTGKGKNRQFRYEERDNDGQVRGHYGYMDKHGKLRVVNYSAHPELGFHAEAPVEKE